MTVRQILARKGAAVFAIPPGASLGDAARRLRHHHVGALLVVAPAAGGTETLVGILSERDIVRALAEAGSLALARPVAAEMSSPVETCAPTDEVRTVKRRMSARRIRHLPVVEGGRVVGVVSMGDVVTSRVLEIEAEAAALQDAPTLRWASALAA